jgi:very-short-patch-repair endonuclease
MTTDDFDLAGYLYEKLNDEDIPTLDKLYGEAWFEQLDYCESPIENILYIFLLLDKPSDMGVLLQQEIRTSTGIRRVDFLIGLLTLRGDFRPMFVVECDGTDFHTKPSQIAQDKRRDREILLEWGLPTVRFTGKEIKDDPETQRIYVHQLFKRGIKGYENKQR